VPEHVHEAPVRQAELAGQSLQQYLAAKVALIATTPTIDEILDRIERRSKGRSSGELLDEMHAPGIADILTEDPFDDPRRFNRATHACPGNFIVALREFLSNPPIAGKSWIWWLRLARTNASAEVPARRSCAHRAFPLRDR
jgi:hypothetical protein